MTLKRLVRSTLVLLAVGLVGLTAGCAEQKKTTTLDEPTVGLEETTVESTRPDDPNAPMEIVSKSWSGYTPKVMDKAVITEVAFPTGHKNSSAILLHQVMPEEVLRGDEYLYEYHVTNLTTMTQQDVVIGVDAVHNLEIVRSTPEARVGDEGVEWYIGNLEPKATQIIKVRATSETVGPASNCVSVTYRNNMCAQTNVVDPDLLLVKTATSEGSLCDEYILTYKISNPGSGMANNIQIKDQLAAGFRTENDKRAILVKAGSLKPGEERTFEVKVKGVAVGTHRSIAVATADGGLISESENVHTIIRQPVLTVTTESQEQLYIGRDVEFRAVITNTGDFVANDTVVVTNVPSNAVLVSSSSGGKVTGNQLAWNLGSLEPDQSREVSVRIKPASVGTARSTITARAECAEPVSDSADTSVVGIAAILLELIDVGDPASLGNEVTYVITATNQGSAADSNIKIACELPPQVELVSAGGATQGAARGRAVAFSPLASLAPGAKAEWRVVVRARDEGNVRFKVMMNTDQLEGTPVEETEATTLYR